MEDKLTWISLLIAVLWTALIIVGIVATVTEPDPLGINGQIVFVLLAAWALGLALGYGIVAAILSWWYRRSERERRLG